MVNLFYQSPENSDFNEQSFIQNVELGFLEKDGYIIKTNLFVDNNLEDENLIAIEYTSDQRKPVTIESWSCTPENPSSNSNFSVSVNGHLPTEDFYVVAINKDIFINEISVIIYVDRMELGNYAILPFDSLLEFGQLDPGNYAVHLKTFYRGKQIDEFEKEITIELEKQYY